MFSPVAPGILPHVLRNILQLQQFCVLQHLSIGIDTRQRAHDDVGVMRPRLGPRLHRVNNFCLLVFLRGPAGALLPVVACYLKTKEMQLDFNKHGAVTPLLELDTVQSAPGLYTLRSATCAC